MDGYRIGQLAEISRVTTETIRYYEKIGLLPPPVRHANGYRVYRQDALRKLEFINRAKNVGFTLSEIGNLLSLSLGSKEKCRETEAQSRLKIGAIESKISELMGMKAALLQLAAHCHGTNRADKDCPILDYFETERKLK